MTKEEPDAVYMLKTPVTSAGKERDVVDGYRLLKFRKIQKEKVSSDQEDS